MYKLITQISNQLLNTVSRLKRRNKKFLKSTWRPVTDVNASQPGHSDVNALQPGHSTDVNESQAGHSEVKTTTLCIDVTVFTSCHGVKSMSPTIDAQFQFDEIKPLLENSNQNSNKVIQTSNYNITTNCTNYALF